MDNSLDMILQRLESITLTDEESQRLKTFCRNVLNSYKWRELDKYIREYIILNEEITPNIRNFFEKLKCKEYNVFTERASTSEIKWYESTVLFQSDEYENIEFYYHGGYWRKYQTISFDDDTFDFHTERDGLKEKFGWDDEDIKSLIVVLNDIFNDCNTEYDENIDWSLYDEDY